MADLVRPPNPTAANVEHLLALKVMRLTRPSLAMPMVIPSDSDQDLLKDVLNIDLERDVNSLKGMEQLSLGQTLIMPQSFGNIYLGETFTSYVSLHNDSTETCSNVSLRCDLQTTTQRISLFPATPGEQIQASIKEFLPGSSMDKVLNHEVKELGAHILVCEVTYSSQQAKEKLHFRKFFKFQVMKPLDVKTKFYNAESEEVFLEAQVQNVTLGPLCLEKVVLDPSQLFTVSSLNSIPNKEDSDGGSVFGRINCLQPQDSRQYLFCLTPKQEVRSNPKIMKGVTNIGKLDIVWRTSMGDRGRLQTSQLQRLAPNHGDVRFVVDSVPSLALVRKSFSITGKIINNCDRTVELELNLINVNQPKMIWGGHTSKRLGLLEPGGSLDLKVDMVPHETGFQVISGIRVIDTLLKRTYEFDDLRQVFVCESESLMETLDCDIHSVTEVIV